LPAFRRAAAQLVIEHPAWTPDQIKGALMQRARYVPEAPLGSPGWGRATPARSSPLTRPRTPNASLNHFLTQNLVLAATRSTVRPGGYVMTPEEEAAALADPELNPDAPATTQP
jgi:hypothetical protein